MAHNKGVLCLQGYVLLLPVKNALSVSSTRHMSKHAKLLNLSLLNNSF